MELFWPVWESILGFAGLLALAWIIRKLNSWITRKIQEGGRSWPYAYGTVEHAEPKMIGDGQTAYWVGELAYSYSVEGQYYSGVFHFPARSENKALAAVRNWKDRRVVVHYLPSDPQKSVLIMEEQNRPVAMNNFDSR